FVTAALAAVRPGVQFRIYDVTGGDEVLLFTNAFRAQDEPSAFRYSRRIPQYGREWRIDFDSAPIERAAPRVAALNGVLALGVLAAFLMYGIAWMLARTEARASAIALRLTEDYRRSEQRFRAAIEHSAIGVALLDSRGRVIECNEAFGATVGRPPAELAGVAFDALLEPADVRAETPRNEPGDVQRGTRRLRRGDGIARHVQLTYSPVPGNVGEDITRMVHMEDVSDRLRAEARIHALNRTLEARVALRTRELSQANHELESFAYSVSHDLRAPLRAIEGFSRILVERYGPSLDDAGRDYLGRVRRAAARMGELIDAMLKMSRMTRGEMRPTALDLSRLAGEVADEVQGGDPARRVHWMIEPGLGVVGDATLLRNLLGNLLGNAFKFTRGREVAEIAFGRTPDDEGGEFFVRDNGAGFSQEYVDKLFRPFQRLHSQEEFSGHGIGLATVKRIVERHGGTIRAEGAPGQGAVFYFTLGDCTPVDAG
ncbi:MAG TPA: ATP-binding protein, partial [Lysobacter sp.]